MSIPAHNGKKAPQFSSFKPAPTPQKPDDCCCEGACSAPEPVVETVKGTRYSWKVSGMDCAACARKVENAVRQVSGVNQVQVLFATEKLVVDSNGDLRQQIEHAVQKRVTPYAMNRRRKKRLNPALKRTCRCSRFSS